ncbi:MAG: ATP-dependent Clp protease ATP-binding subunit ClpX, partial [Verrucomicrobiae bacterium]|nr:ATP-dependent Clp protease ATP-binding subunit ClpX [Verrucomicrobiae bacterium]
RAHSYSGREVLKMVEPEDLITFGFIPEFVGRLPMVTVLDPLTEEQLVKILTQPRNALVKQYQKLFAMEGVELTIGDDALQELATQAYKKGTGARALRGLLERLMLDVMYDIPGDHSVKGVTITRSVVRGESPPILQRKVDQAA